MTSSDRRETAKLYVFPPRGRLAGGFRGDAKPVRALKDERLPDVVIGAWYHEAAVQDADRNRKL